MALRVLSSPKNTFKLIGPVLHKPLAGKDEQKDAVRSCSVI